MDELKFTPVVGVPLMDVNKESADTYAKENGLHPIHIFIPIALGWTESGGLAAIAATLPKYTLAGLADGMLDLRKEFPCMTVCMVSVMFNRSDPAQLEELGKHLSAKDREERQCLQ